MRFKILILVLFSFLFFSAVAHPIKQLLFSQYSQSDGLSSYNVKKIREDKYGLIWIATQDGINRFDGKKFKVFNRNNKDIFINDVPDFVFDDQQSRITCLSPYAAIQSFDLVTEQPQTICNLMTDRIDLLSGSWFQSMQPVAGSQDLLIGTNNGLVRFRKGKPGVLQNVALPFSRQGNKPAATKFILKDKNASIWAFCDYYGILVYDSTGKKLLSSYSLADSHPLGITFNKLAYDSASNCFFAATSEGIWQISMLPDQRINYIPALPVRAPVKCVSIDHAGNIWYQLNHLLYMFDKQQATTYLVKNAKKLFNDDWLANLNDIYFDSKNNLWLGTTEGLYHAPLQDAALIPYGKNYKELENSRCYGLLRDDSTVFVGTSKGLFAFDLYQPNVKHGGDQKFYDVFKLPGREVISVGVAGMFLVDSRPDRLHLIKAAERYRELEPFKNFIANNHCLIGDSLVIFSSENEQGLLCWNLHKKVAFLLTDMNNKPLLANNSLNNVCAAGKDQIIILTDNAIVSYQLSTKSTQTHSIQSANKKWVYKIFFDLVPTTDGYLVSSYGNGVLALDKSFQITRIFDVEHGLSNNGVYKIVGVENNQFLVTTNNGLNKINLSTGSIQRYFETDGLHGNSFEEMSASISGSLVLAGGIGGFTLILPGSLNKLKVAPSVIFTSVQFSGEQTQKKITQYGLTQLTIPPYTNHTRVYYQSANNIGKPGVHYYYRIEEIHTSWINNQETDFVELTGMKPGSYTLRVRASENDLFSPEVSLQFIVEPKWYQSIWFKLLALLIVFVIIHSLFRYRVYQLKKQQEFRLSIAADLHDEIGSTLSGVRIFTDLGIHQNSATYLPQIKLGIQDATISLRDIIWALDQSKNNAAELLERLKKVFQPLLDASGIEFRVVAAPELDAIVLDTDKRQNIYLACKEFINNSIKYAQCNRLLLQFKKHNNLLVVGIADNGIGFSATQVQKGNGLVNIQRRASQIRYVAHVKTALQHGTLLVLYPKSIQQEQQYLISDIESALAMDKG